MYFQPEKPIKKKKKIKLHEEKQRNNHRQFKKNIYIYSSERNF